MLSLMLFTAMGAAADLSAGQAEAAPPSAQRLICRTRPTLGSRITRTRICKTVEEWRIYGADMEQHRRDTADRGARGCGGTGQECN